ncbi:unnamed protein product [Pelagomonas calceolata]|uniref:Uncharacterized protein n=1 Tax=Pelagomonas calceolata TaxID=35677 RepID=A0A8J2WFH8_9STRA|nr:unnamed protein product [Pelagomonas calceolata]
MSLNTNKNSYGATDLEAGTTGSHIKDAAGVGTPRRFAVIATVGVFGLLGFVAAMSSSRSSATASQPSLYNKWAEQGIAAGNYGRQMGQKYGQIGQQMGQQYGQMGRDMGQVGYDMGMGYAQMGQAIGQHYRDEYSGGGGHGHGGNTVSSGDTVINNGKYQKKCKVNGGNYQDSVSWQATVNGEIIKSYCPWVWQNANRKKHCKQMQNNVLVSTACPCACAGY